MGFWWGLWLFALAADPARWWTAIGPLGITLMFCFVSLPMIETRMRERRPAYAEYAESSSLVLPRPWRRA
jgi:steroid 5-alpha reductase family enzyme